MGFFDGFVIALGALVAYAIMPFVVILSLALLLFASAFSLALVSVIGAKIRRFRKRLRRKSAA